MSSTVTTATVSTVTAAVTIEGLGQTLMLIALVLLGLTLVAKELIVVSDKPIIRTLARGLDLGITPLVLAFVLMMVLNAVSYMSS